MAGVASRFGGACTPAPLPKDAPGGSLGFLAGLGNSFVSLLDLGTTAANPLQGAMNMATGNTFSGAYTRWAARHGINTSHNSTYTGGTWAGAVLQMGLAGLAGAAAAGAAADAAAGDAPKANNGRRESERWADRSRATCSDR